LLLLSVLLAVVYASAFSRAASDFKNNFMHEIAIISDDGKIVGLKENAAGVVDSMPKMIISGDEIKFEITEPKVIDKDSSYIPLVFDPTGKFNPENFERAIVLNSKNLIIKIPANTQVVSVNELIRLQYFQRFADAEGVIDNSKLAINVLEIFSSLVGLMAPLMFIAGIFINMLILSVGCLMFAMVTQVMFSLLRVENNDFKNCLRISAYTATPVFLLDMLQLLLMKQLFGLQFLVYFTIRVIYIYTAIDSYRKVELSKINKVV
jgi:hypothetical protein